MGTKARLTADDLWRLPEDECRRELVNGEIVEMAPAGALHGEVVVTVAALLRAIVTRSSAGSVVAGDVGFMLRLPHDRERVRAPDVAFISAERIPESGLPVGFFEGPPDIAVEVLSPSESSTGIAAKVRDYLEAGCSLVLVPAPDARTLACYRPDGSARLLKEPDLLEAEDILRGLTLPVSQLLSS